MSISANNNQTDFRTRLVAFALVLAVGFFMGWWNGRSGDGSSTQNSGIVAQQQEQSSEAPGQEAATSETLAEAPEQPGSAETAPESGTTSGTSPTASVTEDGWYTSRDEVALYIHTYGHLPGNFISKTKARERGWVASEGNLDEVCPGMSIGGSRFYDDDDQLPYKSGRRWTECDINYDGGYRGAERIVFSNDGLVFYTADHYETFEQLY